jgi:hypothetical protein
VERFIVLGRLAVDGREAVVCPVGAELCDVLPREGVVLCAGALECEGALGLLGLLCSGLC